MCGIWVRATEHGARRCFNAKIKKKGSKPALLWVTRFQSAPSFLNVDKSRATRYCGALQSMWTWHSLRTFGRPACCSKCSRGPRGPDFGESWAPARAAKWPLNWSPRPNNVVNRAGSPTGPIQRISRGSFGRGATSRQRFRRMIQGQSAPIAASQPQIPPGNMLLGRTDN